MADPLSELTALAPFDTADLPRSAGACTVSAAAWPSLTSLMPLRGQRAAVEAALGFSLPGPGQSTSAGSLTCLWSGRQAWLLAGPAPDLSAHAAVTDQSDAWAGLTLSGNGARAVLARLCPLDLDPGTFPDGATARTDIAHMPGQILLNGETFTLLVPRSYALHLLHEVEAAMRSVAAQDTL